MATNNNNTSQPPSLTPLPPAATSASGVPFCMPFRGPGACRYGSEIFILPDMATYHSWVYQLSGMRGLSCLKNDAKTYPDDFPAMIHDLMRYWYQKLQLFVKTLGKDLLPTPFRMVMEHTEEVFRLPRTTFDSYPEQVRGVWQTENVFDYSAVFDKK